ncbi:carboxypeptidase-like regulatory domain-containing protein [Edaphobacter aggregans]|uniref:carboxypeptidase-like regulatory domain-containing protein n=1 Tax=Edaphobacter aggregans TaxID=570835 RepID=UPI00054F5BAF|nr:carboxypeptidase-like regulatory domain-containing protein [Edaphobacter aggregans]
MPLVRISPGYTSALAALCLLLGMATASSAGQMSGQLRSMNSTTTSSSAMTSVSGAVLNAATGQPVPRALVRLNDRAMLTDHEGKFEFDQFAAAGNAMLQVNKPGFYSGVEGETMSNTTLRADQIAVPVIVRLYPEALLTGTLTASDGTPLPQVMVTAQRSVYNETGHQWYPAGQNMTNSRGEFRVAVPPGDYRIETAFSPRLRGTAKAILPLRVPSGTSSNASETIHIGSGTEERFDLHPRVAPAYMVSLRLEQSAEGGFPTILARSSDGTVIPLNVARTGPDSELRVQLPSGSFTLMATLNMGEISEYGETTVTVAEQNVSGVVLRMATIPAIPVQVIQDSGSTSDKAPPMPQQLGLMMEDVRDSSSKRGNGTVGLVNSPDHGSFFHAPPGVYRLTARNSGQWFVKSATYGATDLLQQELSISPGSGNSPIVITVSDQTGSLYGTTMVNGSPASVWLYLIPAGRSAAPVYTARSGSDGVFSLPYLPPGSYQAVGFENRHLADYRDPKALAAYSTYIHSVTVNAGDKTELEVNAVPSAEIVP